MPLPNFLIVGAHKSGTTSLYHYLRQHPQIYMSPRKESGFFIYEGGQPDFTGPGIATRMRDVITDIEAYRRLFDDVRDELAIGEASGIYMQESRAVERIRHYVPEARIVAILRDPASRVFSSFTQLRRDGYEPEADLRKALAKEDERRAQNWGYAWYHRRRGFTHDILKQYIEAFGRDRVRVYLYDDLCDDPAKLMADLLPSSTLTPVSALTWRNVSMSQGCLNFPAYIAWSQGRPRSTSWPTGSCRSQRAAISAPAPSTACRCACAWTTLCAAS